MIYVCNFLYIPEIMLQYEISKYLAIPLLLMKVNQFMYIFFLCYIKKQYENTVTISFKCQVKVGPFNWFFCQKKKKKKLKFYKNMKIKKNPLDEQL